MTRLLIISFFMAVGLLFVAGISLAPATWAAPTQTPPGAQTEHVPVNSLAEDSPADNIIVIHPSRGDFEGSYSLNTPARPGFWIAAVFTGLVGAALLITLVLFRPGNSG